MRTEHDKVLRRNLWVNALGLVGRLAMPLALWVVNHLFGPEFGGEYSLGFTIAFIFVSFISVGPGDGVMVFASHHADRAASNPDDARVLRNIVGTALAIAVPLASVIALALLLVGKSCFASFWGKHPRLVEAAPVLGLMLVPIAFSRVAVAVARAHHRMEWEQLLVGFLSPLLMIAGAFGVHRLGGGLGDLFVAHAATEFAIAALACVPLAKYCGIRALFGRRQFQWHPRIAAFGWQTSLTSLVSRVALQVDILMLAAWIDSALLAWYTIAALLIRELRQIRMVIGQSLAPIAARLHHARDTAALEETLGRFTAKALTLAVPAVLVILIFRAEASALYEPTFVGDTTFIVVLCLIPIVNCAFGLADHYLLSFGHSRWLLFNAICMALVTAALNWLLIPTFQLTGAAIAAVASFVLAPVLAFVQIKLLDNVRFRIGHLARHGVALMIVAAAWASFEYLRSDPSLMEQIAALLMLNALWFLPLLVRKSGK